jgi:hypothetical protein
MLNTTDPGRGAGGDGCAFIADERSLAQQQPSTQSVVLEGAQEGASGASLRSWLTRALKVGTGVPRTPPEAPDTFQLEVYYRYLVDLGAARTDAPGASLGVPDRLPRPVLESPSFTPMASLARRPDQQSLYALVDIHGDENRWQNGAWPARRGRPLLVSTARQQS